MSKETTKLGEILHHEHHRSVQYANNGYARFVTTDGAKGLEVSGNHCVPANFGQRPLVAGGTVYFHSIRVT